MARHNWMRSYLPLGALCWLSLTATTFGQPLRPPESDTPPPTPRATQSRTAPAQTRLTKAEMIRQALANHPVTAPYAIRVESVKGKLVLKGRVGTKEIHDVAVRIAMDSGFAIGDDLVISTAESYRSVMAQQQGAQGGAAASSPRSPLTAFRPGTAPTIMPQSVNPAIMGMNQVVYPPPLFGRYDDPFYGMEPPPISYSPWFAGMSAQRLRDPRFLGAGASNGQAPFDQQNLQGSAMGQAGDGGVSGQNQGGALPLGPPPNGDTIELVIDPLGVGLLRGTVDTEAHKLAIGQKVVDELGVSRVLNNLQTREANNPTPQASGNQANANAANDVPPPPPSPASPSATPARTHPGDGEGEQATVNGDQIVIKPQTKTTRLERIRRAIERIPDLEDQTLRVSESDGVATISGDLPSAYEAMLAFRAVERIPGVAKIIDKIRFPVPDDDHPNPLLKRARADDLEPYFKEQIQRQLGELAHVDRVKVMGDHVNIIGSLDTLSDERRVIATLRTLPILRGFQIEPSFRAD